MDQFARSGERAGKWILKSHVVMPHALREFDYPNENGSMLRALETKLPNFEEVSFEVCSPSFSSIFGESQEQVIFLPFH